MFVNIAMKEIMNNSLKNDIHLSNELQNILDDGVEEFDYGLILFKQKFLINKNFNIEKALQIYQDKSGIENFQNKINIDDYVFDDTSIINSGFLFLEKFNALWQDVFPKISCISILTFDLNEEFGLGCAFRFYRKRTGEEIYDIQNLDEYTQPIAVNVYEVSFKNEI
ncbi:MAG: hypothetical protein H9855_04140 [Candidatus Acinetobacter avistercoris]|nr:hypothetical protein [Candidatus Acinetobacter avistercoris]